eukprot:jgi/Botrbrau1/1635/Bobra.0185s0045.1
MEPQSRVVNITPSSLAARNQHRVEHHAREAQLLDNFPGDVSWIAREGIHSLPSEFPMFARVLKLALLEVQRDPGHGVSRHPHSSSMASKPCREDLWNFWPIIKYVCGHAVPGYVSWMIADGIHSL